MLLRHQTKYDLRIIMSLSRSDRSSVLFFSRPRSEDWTYFLNLSLYSAILIDSSMMSPVHVLMLSIQAVRGLPRLRAPVIISFSRQLVPLLHHAVTRKRWTLYARPLSLRHCMTSRIGRRRHWKNGLLSPPMRCISWSVSRLSLIHISEPTRPY